MSTFDDDPLDAQLRAMMHEEAETITPAGDGLSKIQQRVASRRARLRWFRPAVVLGSAAALALIGVGAYAVVHNPDKGNDSLQTATTPTPSETPPVSESPSPTPTVVPVSTGFPRRAIFPFTTAAAERTWERAAAQGHMPWVQDPKSVASFWVQNYLQLPSVTDVQKIVTQPGTPETADVTLGRTLQAEGQQPFAVTVVHLVQYGKAWIVTGASDGRGLLRISSPGAGTTVSSPVSVVGPGFGVDEAADVQVRDAATPTRFGHGGTGSFGGHAPWSASVSFSRPTGTVGVIAIVEASQADGLPARLTVEQVHFGTTTGGSTAPQYFYGIKNQRVTKFASRNGAAIDYLTLPEPGGGASDPQLVGSDVYFLRGGGTCANAIAKVSSLPADNTQPVANVVSPDDGYTINGYSVTGKMVAFFEQTCDGRSPQAKLVTLDKGTGQRHVVRFPSLPPAVIGDPSFEPAADTRFLDAIVATGTQSRFYRYDAMSGSSPTPSRNVCPGYDVNNGRPWALETDSTGVVWFATQTGSSMQVVRCMAGGNTALVTFTVPGNRQPADVDVSSNGAVLVTDVDGHVWRWDGSGAAIQLTPSVSLTQVTW